MRHIWSAPLAAQIVALVVLAVVAAQLVSLAVVLTSPPPERAELRIGEAAELLAGAGSEQVRTRYTVTLQRGPPADNREDPEERQLRLALARSLAVDAGDVRVMLRGGGPAGPGGPPPPGGGKLHRQLFRPVLSGEAATMALRMADGRWRWVQPRRTGLLDPWQERALLWFLVTALVVCPLGYAFARRLSAPIRSFADAAERLGRDPRALPLTVAGPAEIGIAAAAFNQMQERLRRYVEDRTAMIAAIAHDLRTPLTRLAFRLEDAPEGLREKAAADIAEMQAMVAATLEFVRDTQAAPQRAKLDLGALLQTAADNLADIGEVVEIEPGERVVVTGDPTALGRLINNLLVNACKYGGEAVARLRREEGNAVLEVDDNGPGLSEADLTRVFEPFYRAEASRSRETGGIGLGLAVVRTIAHAHGGEVALFNRPEGGLRARVTLPL